MRLTALAGVAIGSIAVSAISFFARYLFPIIPQAVAWAGLTLGVLLFLSQLTPLKTGPALLGCISIAMLVAATLWQINAEPRKALETAKSGVEPTHEATQQERPATNATGAMISTDGEVHGGSGGSGQFWGGGGGGGGGVYRAPDGSLHAGGGGGGGGLGQGGNGGGPFGGGGGGAAGIPPEVAASPSWRASWIIHQARLQYHAEHGLDPSDKWLSSFLQERGFRFEYRTISGGFSLVPLDSDADLPIKP